VIQDSEGKDSNNSRLYTYLSPLKPSSLLDGPCAVRFVVTVDSGMHVIADC